MDNLFFKPGVNISQKAVTFVTEYFLEFMGFFGKVLMIFEKIFFQKHETMKSKLDLNKSCRNDPKFFL